MNVSACGRGWISAAAAVFVVISEVGGAPVEIVTCALLQVMDTQ